MSVKWVLVATATLTAIVAGSAFAVATNGQEGSAPEARLTLAESRGDLPEGEAIGVLFDLPRQDTYKGCSDFVEYDDPHGFCMEGIAKTMTDPESALLGRAIMGSRLTGEQVGIVRDLLTIHRLQVAGTPNEALESAVAADARAWWEANLGRSADDHVMEDAAAEAAD